jgi:hypothetical protein
MLFFPRLVDLDIAEIKCPFCEVWETSRTTIKHQIQRLRAQLTELKQIRKYLRCVYFYCRLHWYVGVMVLLTGKGYWEEVRGVLGNKCAGHHNLKTVKIREIMLK